MTNWEDQEAWKDTAEVPVTAEASKAEIFKGVGFRTAAHEAHPDRNEDSILIESNALGVFDGVGGRGGGDAASRIARDVIAEWLRPLGSDRPVEEVKEKVAEALRAANQAIIEEQQRSSNGKMSTTATVACLAKAANGERALVFGQVGDSRGYLLRDGVLERLTQDDSEFAPTKEILDLWDRVASKEDFEDEVQEATFHYRNFISKALGTDAEIAPQIYAIGMDENDKILVSSDGIHDNLTTEEIQNILSRNASPEETANVLVEAATERSRDKNHLRHKADDMTAVLAKF